MKAKAEAAKAEGNKHFSSKKYDEAIECYSSAIKFDPTNHVFFSNRAACYGAKGDYGASKADAMECIKLAPNFLKGYYRMVQAQIELGDFDGATNTAKAGLELDSDNSELQKQLRSIRTKKAAAASMAKNQQMGRPVNQGEAKELLELQDQMQATRREMNEVQQYLAGCEREQRMAELSKENIGEYPADTVMYRSVGKMFLQATRAEIDEYHTLQGEKQVEKQKALSQKVRLRAE